MPVLTSDLVDTPTFTKLLGEEC